MNAHQIIASKINVHILDDKRRNCEKNYKYAASGFKHMIDDRTAHLRTHRSFQMHRSRLDAEETYFHATGPQSERENRFWLNIRSYAVK
jgi:hypothetical protein